MQRSHLWERALPVMRCATWILGLFTVLYGFWAWIALGRTTGLMISLAIISAGPLEDLLNRKPRLGLSESQSVDWVDQITSILFLLFLAWGISAAL